MTWLFLVLLVAAVALVAGAEWPRIVAKTGIEARRRRDRERRKSNLRVIRTERDEFEASVQRDLADLPTIEERETRS